MGTSLFVIASPDDFNRKMHPAADLINAGVEFATLAALIAQLGPSLLMLGFLTPGFVLRMLLFAGLWVVLTRADPLSWIIGAPVVAAAAWASARLNTQCPLARIALRQLPGFIGFFLLASLRGGLDVARRILASPPAITPGFIRYHTGLSQPGARVFFLDLISLLPGTLSADLDAPDQLVIHTLDQSADNRAELAQLERRVAALWREA